MHSNAKQSELETEVRLCGRKGGGAKSVPLQISTSHSNKQHEVKHGPHAEEMESRRSGMRKKVGFAGERRSW